ncbi:MAG: hypothetical protein AAGJ46_21870, partial [Planctomycetota bacterium]
EDVKALKSYFRAIEVSPDLADPYEAAAKLLEDSGRGALASPYRQKAMELRAAEQVNAQP